jgi:hypothetical protein
MAFHCQRTGHYSRPPSRRVFLIGIAVMAATLVLAACGGGMSVTTAPSSPTAAAIASATPVAISGRQGGSATMSAPAATVPAIATQTIPIVAPTSGASVAADATRPPAAPNANAGSATGKVDACTLVTKPDYLVVMGDAANDPVKKDRPVAATSGFSASSCEYKIASADKVEFVTVNIMQRSPNASAQLDMKTYWEGTKKAWASMQATITPLPEIGPEVFLVVNPTLEQIGAGGAVHFFKGDVIFDVQAVTGSGTIDEQNAAGTVAAKKLAIMAFGRL